MTARVLNALLRLTAPAGDASWQKLKSGDTAAFTRLVQAHQDSLHRFCFRMLGDSEDARDATQDIFLLVHRHLATFREEARLSTWMYRIALNHCLNRKKSNRRREENLAHSTEPADPIADTNTPEEALATAIEVRRLQRSLLKLDDSHRALVVLRDIEGLSYDDIARITQLPEGTVKSRLHRAREELTELMTAGAEP